MKNVKKLLISVFALSALMLGACSGSQQTSSSTPASSSSTQPTTTSTEPTPASSDAEDSSAEEESSVEEESSAEEESSSEEGPIEHAVTLNEAPTSGRVVVVHGWNDLGGVADIRAEVDGDVVKFSLMPDDDLTGYLIAELKEGKTFDDFSFLDPEDATKIKHDWNVVARQTTNITDLSATEASWQSVAPATEYAFTLDSSATTAFAGRTFFVCSWKEGYINVYDYFTASKNAKIATAADGFLVGVLKEGKTADDGVGDDWANVDKQSSNVTTNPTTSVEIYAAGGVLKVGLDGETPSAAYTVDVYLKVSGAADWNATGKVVYAHVWDGGDNDKYVATVYDDAYQWKKPNEQHYTVPVDFLPTNIQFILCSADQVPDIPTAWPGDDKVEAKTQAAVESWSGGPGANLTTLG